MTPLMLHAVGLACCGEWRLLDALEVLARSKDDPDFAGILHARGCETLLGFAKREPEAEADECDVCGGDGYLMATGHNGREYELDCPECDGSHATNFRAEPIGPHDIKRWQTLSGDRRSVERLGALDSWMNRATAAAVVRDYGPLVERLHTLAA